MYQNPQSFWSISAAELLNKLQATAGGLTTDFADLRRNQRYRTPEKNAAVRPGTCRGVAQQLFYSPITARRIAS